MYTRINVFAPVFTILDDHGNIFVQDAIPVGAKSLDWAAMQLQFKGQGVTIHHAPRHQTYRMI